MHLLDLLTLVIKYLRTVHHDQQSVLDDVLKRVDLTKPATPADLLAILETLEAPALLEEVRSRFVDDEEFHTQTLKLASFNPNGFLRVPLWRPGLSQHLRLHIWLNRPVDTSGVDIHNHRWAFASRVLRGSLIAETFVEDPSGPLEVLKYLHEPDPASGGFRLSEVGPCALTRVNSVVIESGETHSVEHLTLHRISCDSDTATLVIEGSTQRHTTDVYTGRRRSEEPQPPSRASAMDLERAFEFVAPKFPLRL